MKDHQLGTKYHFGFRFIGVFAASLMLLSACGGGGADSPTVAPASAPPPPTLPAPAPVPTPVPTPTPTVTLNANPGSVNSGASSTLTWSSTDATSCTATGNWSGAQATSGTASTGALTSASSFTLSCSGSGGTASATATVNITASAPAPTIAFTANPTSVASGSSSTLTWSTTNAATCTGSGGWSGSKAINGSQSTGVLTATTTYTLSCSGSGGLASQSVNVIVTSGTAAKSYSTNFDITENPISEGGVWHRANNAWTNVRVANGIAFGTNGPLNLYDDSYALLSGFGPDQQSQAVIARSPSLVAGITHEVELLLRFSDDANNARGYECLFAYFGGVEIVRWNGAIGDFTVLSVSGGPANLGRDLVSGDVVSASVIGNVISVYINGVLMGRATDSTYATGQPGISFFTRPGGDSANYGITSFSASSN